MLSSTLRFRKSTIRKIEAPTSDIISIFEIFRICCSNINNTKTLIPKEAKNPDIYPTNVLFEDLGIWILPNFSPNIDAAPSPKVAINATAVNTPKGRKSVGTRDKTKATGLVNS